MSDRSYKIETKLPQTTNRMSRPPCSLVTSSVTGSRFQGHAMQHAAVCPCGLHLTTVDCLSGGTVDSSRL